MPSRFSAGRARTSWPVVLILAGCGVPMGSEGGPCTAGGACDPGLTCASKLCVDVGSEGEGEGDTCAGDEPARASVADCSALPVGDCSSEQGKVTCELAGLTLRSGLFQRAFDCIAEISTAQCDGLGPPLEACFSALTACANPDADRLCQDALDQCAGFPRDVCVADLRPTNVAFRTAFADCFNQHVEVACTDVEEYCYNVAINTLVGG